MKAIVYTSGTGFTQRYARLLAERTGVPAYDWKEAGKAVPRGSEIFYMGWLMAGTVKGLSAAMDRYTIRGAAIVGINAVGNGDLWTEARINGGVSDGGARIFYLRGGYAPEKLRGIQKLMMWAMAKSVVKKIQALGERATAQDREMLEVFQHGGDFVREEDLEELVEWFRSGPHDGVLKAAPTVDI